MSQEVWNKVLSSNEEIKYEFTIGKKYRRLGIIIGIIIGLPLLFTLTSWGILIILSFLFYSCRYLEQANIYAFTNKRILIHKGLFSTRLISVDYDKITDVTVVEPLLEKVITETGDLLINTAGTTFHEIILQHIERPYEIKRKLDEIREAK